MSNDRMTDEEIAKSLGIPVSNLKLGKEAKKRQAADRLRKLQETADMESKKYGVKISAEDVKARNETVFKKSQEAQAKKVQDYRSGEGMEASLEGKREPKGGESSGDRAAKAAAAQKLLAETGLDGNGTENAGLGAAGGAASGALAGYAFGPGGALIGGTIGGISGGLKARAAKKRRLAEIEANKFKALGDIELHKADSINKALDSLQDAFKSSLLSQGNLVLF